MSTPHIQTINNHPIAASAAVPNSALDTAIASKENAFTVLPVSKGGTGSDTVVGARTNLDVYSKSETNSLLNGTVVILSALPATGEENKVYYIGPSGSGDDQYEEYLWDTDNSQFIKVGERSVDLSNYLQKNGDGTDVTTTPTTETDYTKPTTATKLSVLFGKIWKFISSVGTAAFKNVVTSWSSTVSDDNVPSEKLVKGELDGKVPTTLKVNNHELSSDVNITAADVGAATSGHTHPLTLASGGTSTVNLAADTTYTLTAGGKSVAFKTPLDNNTDTKVTSAANHYSPTRDTSADKSASASGATAAWSIDVVKGVTLQTDGKGHVTGVAVTSGKIPANPNTDTKVTSAANHYAPSRDTSADKSASASGATAAWSIDVVKGVTLQTDGKGHVTGVAVTSGKIPANPNTDTKVTSAANHYAPSRDTSADKSASASGATAAWSIDVVKGVTLQTDGKGHVTGVTVTSGKIPAKPSYTAADVGAATSGHSHQLSDLGGTLSGTKGGTGQTSLKAGASALLCALASDWTSPPNDDTYMLRREFGGLAEYGQVKASAFATYFKGKIASYTSINGAYALPNNTNGTPYFAVVFNSTGSSKTVTYKSPGSSSASTSIGATSVGLFVAVGTSGAWVRVGT